MSKQYTYLSWIDDDSLCQAVQYVYLAYRKALATTNLEYLQRNVIDPFLTIFEVNLRNDLSIEDWLKQEAQRQIQKSLNNAVGDFHQMILGSVTGWVNLGKGHATELDIRNDDSTIFAEIKNKYSTVSGSKLDSAFDTLKRGTKVYPKSTFYFVQIIRKRQQPYDEIWKFKDKNNNELNENPKIRLISGDSFYDLVAGKNSLSQLVNKLPDVVNDLFKTKDKLEIGDLKAYQELETVLGNSFSNKEGFLYLFNKAYKSSD